MKGDNTMARKNLTDEEMKEKMELDAVLKEMQSEFNGCPLFEGREKGSLDDLEGQQLHIEDIYPLSDFHCVVFEEIPNLYFLTGGALKDLCNNYKPEHVIGRLIEVQPMVKTKSRRDFRPIKVLA